MSSKVYFRWLAIFVAVLGTAQIGWFIYFSTPPARPNRPAGPRRLTFPKLSSPTFKYMYPVEGERASDTVWREVEIPSATGQKLMTLLRGSKSWSAIVDDSLREHPGSMAPSQRFPDSVGRLSAYEDGSDKPSLTVEFLGGYDQVVVLRPDGKANTFFAWPEQAKKIEDAVADIQWGPIPKDES